MSSGGGPIYSNAFGRLVLAPIAARGHARYVEHDTTPRSGYRAMRKLYGNANPELWDRLVGRGGAEHPPLPLPPNPAGAAAGHVDDLVSTLQDDGFVVLPDRLPEPLCAQLEAVARGAECRLVHPVGGTGSASGDGPPASAVWDADAPVAVRYDVAEEDIVASPAAQALLADESLLAVAQGYLGSAPVQDLVAMWWSAAVGEGASSEAAQLFHFDLDRLRFLKFFVFLTDVDESTGPHVYVHGSHTHKPDALRRDGRHSDDEVEAAFPGGATTITGPRGTMFLADTIGLHKGLGLEQGHRLVFQLEWASSLFGAPYDSPVVHGAGPELADAVRRYPWTFRRFDLRPI